MPYFSEGQKDEESDDMEVNRSQSCVCVRVCACACAHVHVCVETLLAMGELVKSGCEFALNLDAGTVMQ